MIRQTKYGTWQFTIEEGVGVDENGKPRRIRKWYGGYPTKKEAKRAEVEELGLRGRGESVERSKITLGTFLLNEWLPAIKGEVAPSTFVNYRGQVESYVIPALGHRPIQDIRPAEISKLYSNLQETGRKQGEGGLSKTSTRNVGIVLGRALETAVDWGYLIANPAKKAKKPTREPREMRIWTPEQVKAFLQFERDTREYPIWRLALYTGARRGEILGLSWDGVDLDAGRLSIYQSLNNVDNQPMLRKTTKTKSGRRLIALDDDTVTDLREHRRCQNEERLLAGPLWNNEHNLVFVDQVGHLIKPERITRIFNSRVKAAALPRIRLHDCRHSFASNALRAGVNVKVLSERLGHNDITTTLSIYAHTIPSQDEEVAAVVAAMYA